MEVYPFGFNAFYEHQYRYLKGLLPLLKQFFYSLPWFSFLLNRYLHSPRLCPFAQLTNVKKFFQGLILSSQVLLLRAYILTYSWTMAFGKEPCYIGVISGGLPGTRLKVAIWSQTKVLKKWKVLISWGGPSQNIRFLAFVRVSWHFNSQLLSI